MEEKKKIELRYQYHGLITCTNISTILESMKLSDIEEDRFNSYRGVRSPFNISNDLRVWLREVNNGFIKIYGGDQWIQTHGYILNSVLNYVFINPKTNQFIYQVERCNSDIFPERKPSLGIWDSFDLMIEGISIIFSLNT
jgi:hypothetical protein